MENLKAKVQVNQNSVTLLVNRTEVGTFDKEIVIEIIGNVGAVDTNVRLVINGDVTGAVDGTNINCGEVHGDVDGTNITCGPIHGDVDGVNVVVKGDVNL